MSYSYEDFTKEFKGFDGTLYLYIEGSQGVSPNSMQVTYGVDFKSVSELVRVFCDFIDENALENIDNYLEDCDGDSDEAMAEAVCDSGHFYLGVSLDSLTHEFDGFSIFRK